MFFLQVILYLPLNTKTKVWFSFSSFHLFGRLTKLSFFQGEFLFINELSFIILYIM